MKVLIGCEFSGIVRDAFASLGHDAWSCDLEATELPGNHYQCDVRDVINNGWDLAIFHPPCTYISKVSAKLFDVSKYGYRAIERMRLREEAIKLFCLVKSAKINMICVENPVLFKSVITKVGMYSQIIHPYYFGDNASKKTCLWLKNLPLLKATNIVDKGQMINNKKGTLPLWYSNTKGGNRTKMRCRTFPGIAMAMAEQFSAFAHLQNNVL